MIYVGCYSNLGLPLQIRPRSRGYLISHATKPTTRTAQLYHSAHRHSRRPIGLQLTSSLGALALPSIRRAHPSSTGTSVEPIQPIRRAHPSSASVERALEPSVERIRRASARAIPIRRAHPSSRRAIPRANHCINLPIFWYLQR